MKLDPEAFKPSDYLTDDAMKLLPLIDQACLATGETVFCNLTTAQTYNNTNWLTSDAFTQDCLTHYNGAGLHALAAPMLVVQGKGDTPTYPDNYERDFDRACGAFPDSSTKLFLVPELGHDPAFRAATPYYWTWVKRPFAGTLPKAGCQKTVVKPVNDRFKRGLAG
ncbi:Alpha/Beta hydrolase protein [Apiospora hydei]|uniref:Alpha/Beta hydrolase protein n=1 Tax=Apiospora hydei TaxID=1337664 RepID=A0ABR1WFT2_9PEZI